MQRLHARKTFERYIRLLSIILYYLPHARALVAISSFCTTRIRNARNFFFFFFPPLLAFPPLSLSLSITGFTARSWPTPINSIVASMNITVDKSDKSRRELFAKRYVPTLLPFFPHLSRICLIRTSSTWAIDRRSYIYVQTGSSISILSVWLAHCLFVKLRMVSCSVPYANE